MRIENTIRFKSFRHDPLQVLKTVQLTDQMCFGCNSISIKGNLTLRKRCNSLDKAILYDQANKPDKWHRLT